MTNPMHPPTTVSNIGVAMFTIANQDAAIAYYTQTLGWALRADVPSRDEGGNRWVEVAPPGSIARLALNPPMGEWQPGGSAIGVETPDVNAEYARVTAIDGVTTTDPMGARARFRGCSRSSIRTATTSGSFRQPLSDDGPPGRGAGRAPRHA